MKRPPKRLPRLPPQGGRYQRPGKAGSAVSLAFGCAGFIEPGGGTPRQVSDFIGTEMVKWAQVAKEAGIQPECKLPYPCDTVSCSTAGCGLDNVVLLPHLASNTHETRAAMAQRVEDNLAAFFGGRPLVSATA